MDKYICSQVELENISTDEDCSIIINFNGAVISKKYKNPIVIIDNYLATALNNAMVIAQDSSAVIAYGESHITAKNNSFVLAATQSKIFATDNACVKAKDNSLVRATGNSKIIAEDKSEIYAYENSSVVAFHFNTIYAHNLSNVKAFGNSVVYYTDTVTVDVKEFAVAILDKNKKYFSFNEYPLTIEDYLKQYSLEKIDNNKFKAYKIAHKIKNRYYSSFKESFEYIIGEEIQTNNLNTDIYQEHGEGIHMAHLDWLLKYAEHWDNPAILEVECDLNGVIIPVVGGKIRAKKCKILREIPIEECGTTGVVLKRKMDALKNY